MQFNEVLEKKTSVGIDSLGVKVGTAGSEWPQRSLWLKRLTVHRPPPEALPWPHPWDLPFPVSHCDSVCMHSLPVTAFRVILHLVT